MSLRYERNIAIAFPINSQDKIRDFFIAMQRENFFLGELANSQTEDFYCPTVTVRNKSHYDFADGEGRHMFTTTYQYEAEKIYGQLVDNGFNPEMTERVETVEKNKEEEIPSFASLYLTDRDKTAHTIEGEDMTLDVWIHNYNWRQELSISYLVQWTTNEKRAPKEIESKMNDYFISEIAHIQQILVDSLLEHNIIFNEPTLDCKFECMNHTSKACSQDIADATLNRITEVME